MKNDRHLTSQMSWPLGIALAVLFGSVLLIASFTQIRNNPNFCTVISGGNIPVGLQQKAILHYATSKAVPQQSLQEISVTFNVLQSRSNLATNFLVFGLGIDSLMWASFNPHGTTLFLEEDPKWVHTVLKDAPTLRAHTVSYRTKLSEAHDLIAHYHTEKECRPSRAFLRGNQRCKLALEKLPEEVYDKEWDLIMIDAPRGYFPEAPGRMGAIYSAAVMARQRKGSGVTHVFLHDVDRKVEKVYAEMFLCRKNLVKAVGRLWHFRIPSMANVSQLNAGDNKFC